VRHRFYWWNNAGVEIWPDTRIYYPMRFAAPDGVSEIESWPVNSKGKDLSVIANQTDGQISIFAYGSNEPFMGVYSPHTESGLVHWADPKTVPSKKLFSWGLPDGLTWSETLSDNHSRYMEVQSGLFQDQNTYEFLVPRQSIRFEEFWMPVRNLGAISRATLDGVVSLRRETKADGKLVLKLAFNANHSIPGAAIVVSDGEHAVYQETVSLEPATTWEHEIADLVPEKQYTFLLKNAKGEILLTHTEGVYDVIASSQVRVGPQPEKKLPDPKVWTEVDFLASANDRELQGESISALEIYQQGLAKYPASLPLLKAAGRLAVGRWHFEDASRWLGHAAAIAPADAEVHYYRGIAETALDHSSQAHSEFEAARLSAEFRPAAGLLVAELMAREHDTANALKLLEESCPAVDRDLRCIEETVALERANKEFDRAKALVVDSLQRNPTSLFLRNEAAKLGVAAKPDSFAPDMNKHLAADTSRVLNLVREYNRLGLYADSIELLSRTYPSVAPEESEPAAPQPSNDPLLAYYRGFSREKLGQPGAADYAAAAAMPLLYIFPNDVDDFAVLRAALVANGSDASAHFLLGSLLFSKNLVDPGMAEWKRAEALNPRIPSLQDNVGRVLLQIKKQPAEAVAEFQSGIKIEPANPGLYMGLNEAMRELGRSAGQRADMLLRFPDPANMPPDFVRAVVNALNESGRNKEVDAFLKKRFVPAKEGQAPLQPSN
jgi:Flp pilus assembly protein TadD